MSLKLATFLSIALLTTTSPATAQTLQTSGECSPIISTSSGVAVNVKCVTEDEKPELDLIVRMLNAAAKQNSLSDMQLTSLVRGIGELLRLAFEHEKSDAASTHASLAHIESMLSDIETTVPVVTMVNNGTVSSSGQTGGLTAANAVINGAEHSKLYRQLGDCSAEGYAIETSTLRVDITDAEIDVAWVQMQAWANKVAVWLKANMLPSALPAFANRPVFAPQPWSLDSTHKDQERSRYHAIQYGLPPLLSNLDSIARTDLYDPPDDSRPHAGPCSSK